MTNCTQLTHQRQARPRSQLGTGLHRFVKESDPGSYGFPLLSTEEMEAAVSLAVADPAVSALMVRGFELIERPAGVGGWEGVSCVTARCVVVILHHNAINRDAWVQVDLGAELVVGVSTP